MILMIGFYADADPARRGEFLECIRRNIANTHIEEIVIFLEDETTSAAVHLKGTVFIVANADIFFDETLALLEEEPLGGRMLCLSRWDQAADGTIRLFEWPDSQDAWIFETPIPPIAADFCLGKPGSDNRLAYEAERAGLVVLNPSRSVRARHLHNTGVRRYTSCERLDGPIRLVPASFLEAPASVARLLDTPMSGFPSHRGFRAASLVKGRFQEIESVLTPYLEGVMPGALRRELLRLPKLWVMSAMMLSGASCESTTCIWIGLRVGA